VVLTLHRGRTIDEGQISAVVHLISSSVPELSAKSITVVDQAGNLLSAGNAEARGLDTSQLKYAQGVEQDFIRRIEAILQPMVGAGNIHAQVSADIDFSVVENTDEKFRPNADPANAAIRSQQVSESGQQGASGPGGVPGALSNQAPSTPTAPLVAASQGQQKTPAPASAASKTGLDGGNTSATASAGGLVNARKDGTTNYELDHSIRHVQQGAGAIKRLSVAVLVNYRSALNAQGKPEAQALSAADLEKMKNLVKETMGFNAERGDSVNVVNSPFASEVVVETPVVPWWKQPDNIEMAKEVGKNSLIGILALYILFGVLRPLLRNVLQPTAHAPVPAQEQHRASDETGGGESPSTRGEAPHYTRHQENVKYAQDSAVKGPQMVAVLVKSWMDKKDG
jgi:flagellar M-ring protein FliF